MTEVIKEKADLQYIWPLESKLATVKIRIKIGVDAFSDFENSINHIIESLTFKDFQVDKRSITIIEATEEEFTTNWVKEEAQSGSNNDKIPKLDSLLFYLKSQVHSFRIVDTGTEIRNWEDFFNWKPKSRLKDYEVFAFQNWAGEFFQVFSSYMHLGEYDSLRIHNLSDKSLEFLFSKVNGNTITWILEYEGSHKFPINKNMKLDRFLYSTIKLYKRKSDDKVAYEVAFLINDNVYRVKVENLSVY